MSSLICRKLISYLCWRNEKMKFFLFYKGKDRAVKYELYINLTFTLPPKSISTLLWKKNIKFGQCVILGKLRIK